MLRQSEFREAKDLTKTILDELYTSIRDDAAVDASSLLYYMSKHALDQMRIIIKTYDFSVAFNRCFALALLSGGTSDDFFRVRQKIRGLSALHEFGKSIIEAGKRMTLICECRAITIEDLKTSERCSALQARLNGDFDSVITAAADRMEYAVSRSFVALHSAITADISARGRRLPYVASYSFNSNMPSLVLANRIHGDASYADELRELNASPHPLFMQKKIRAVTTG